MLIEIMIQDSDHSAYPYHSSPLRPFWPLENLSLPSRSEAAALLDNYFYDLIAAVYTHIPDMAIKFWDNLNLKRFLETAGFAKQPSKQYLRMIGSLGNSEEGALRAYAHLDKLSNSGYMTWGYFIKWLKRYLDVYRPDSALLQQSGEDRRRLAFYSGSRNEVGVVGGTQSQNLATGSWRSGWGGAGWGNSSGYAAGGLDAENGLGRYGRWDRGDKSLSFERTRAVEVGGERRVTELCNYTPLRNGHSRSSDISRAQQMQRAERWVGHLVAFLQMMQKLLRKSERNRLELGLNKSREWGVLRVLFDIFLSSEHLEMKVDFFKYTTFLLPFTFLLTGVRTENVGYFCEE